jgi:hypothetical protein
MKYAIVFAVLIVLAVLMPELVSAQPMFPQPPDQAPIDGGLTILAAAGGAYAINKLRKNRK